MPDSSHHSASGPRPLQDADDLQRLTRAARVEAAYLRSVSLDVRKHRRFELAIVGRRHRDARTDGQRRDNAAPTIHQAG